MALVDFSSLIPEKKDGGIPDDLTPDPPKKKPDFLSLVPPSPTANVIRAMKRGYQEGSDGSALTPEGEAELTRLYEQGGIKGGLAVLLKTVADDVQTVMGVGGGVFKAIQAGVQQIGAEFGDEALGRDIAGMMESEFGRRDTIRPGPLRTRAPGELPPRIEPTVGPLGGPPEPTPPGGQIPAPSTGFRPATPPAEGGFTPGTEGPRGASLEEAGIRPPEPATETETVAVPQGDGTVAQVQVGTGEPPRPPNEPPPPTTGPNTPEDLRAMFPNLSDEQFQALFREGVEETGRPTSLDPAGQLGWLRTLADTMTRLSGGAATGGGRQPAPSAPGQPALPGPSVSPTIEGTALPPDLIPDEPKNEKKPEPEAEKPPTETAYGGPWTPVKTKSGEDARNNQGEPLFENPNGVRATFDNGIPHTESVVDHPEKGMIPRNPIDRRGQFLSTEELGKAATQTEAKPTPKPEAKPKEEWTYLGTNEDGEKVYENPQGVRSSVTDGIRSTEKVRLRSTPNGMEMSVPPPDQKDPEFQVVKSAEPQEKVNTKIPADIPKTAYHGIGRADAASVYNPMNAAVPIAGQGRYSAFSEKVAKQFGDQIEQHPIDLQNPLIIRSDNEWRALTQEAGWEYSNPFGIQKDKLVSMTDDLKKTVMNKGHDGIIVYWDNDSPYDVDRRTNAPIKNLRNVFGDPQVIDYRASQKAPPNADQAPSATPGPATPKAETEAPPKEEAKPVAAPLPDWVPAIGETVHLRMSGSGKQPIPYKILEYKQIPEGAWLFRAVDPYGGVLTDSITTLHPRSPENGGIPQKEELAPKPTEHPGLVVTSLGSGKTTTIQPPGTVPPGNRVPTLEEAFRGALEKTGSAQSNGWWRIIPAPFIKDAYLVEHTQRAAEGGQRIVHGAPEGQTPWTLDQARDEAVRRAFNAKNPKETPKSEESAAKPVAALSAEATSSEPETNDIDPATGEDRGEAPPKANEAEQAPAPVTPDNPLVTHVTKKGKTLTGTIRTDLTEDQAKAIDPYAFRKNGGWFIRSKPTKIEPKEEPVTTPEQAATQAGDVPSPEPPPPEPVDPAVAEAVDLAQGKGPAPVQTLPDPRQVARERAKEELTGQDISEAKNFLDSFDPEADKIYDMLWNGWSPEEIAETPGITKSPREIRAIDAHLDEVALERSDWTEESGDPLPSWRPKDRFSGDQGTLRFSDEGGGPEGVQPVDPQREDGSTPSANSGAGAPDAEGYSGGQAKGRSRSRVSGGRGGGRGSRKRNSDRVSDTGEGSEPGATERPPEEVIAEAKGQDFIIGPDDLGESRGRMQKARDNVKAIELAKRLTADQQLATVDQQRALVKYVGWGGLKPAFRDGKGNFGQDLEKVGKRLEELLTPEELRTAARSVQYAHYTAEHVIRSMWDAVERLGFTGGSIFEPGMGIGHFRGLMPPDLAEKSQYRGVEMDHLTADIAKLLYPNSGVRQADFTQMPLPENSFDLVIGNPPFSSTVITSDPKYSARRFMLHDYFFAKSLDAVRPGGLLAFVTSAGTMNKMDPEAREYLAQRGQFLGGVRLPSSAFRENAGTDVTTDILFFKRRPEGERALADIPEDEKTWTLTAPRTLPDDEGQPIQGISNQYFNTHPEMVLGEEGFFDKLYEGRYAVRQRPGTDLASDLRVAISRLPEGVMDPPPTQMESWEQDFDAPETKDGSYYLKNGVLMQYANGAGKPVARRGKKGGGMTKAEYATVTKLVPIRDALRAVFRADLAGDEAAAKTARADLNKQYDAFVEEFGPINKAEISYRRPTIIQQEGARREAREEARYVGDRWFEGDFDAEPFYERNAKLSEIAAARQAARDVATLAGKPFIEGSFDPDDMPDTVIDQRPNIKPFMQDPESYRLRSIEDYDDSTGEGKKREIFYRNPVSKYVEPELKSANDGLLWSLNSLGRFDPEAIAEKMGRTKDSIISDLGDLVFELPEAPDTWHTRDEYLSGDVKTKLAQAQEAAQRDRKYERNVNALEGSQPVPLGPGQITLVLGMPWIPMEFVRDFTREELELGTPTITYSPDIGRWLVEPTTSRWQTDTAIGLPKWSTPRRTAYQLLEDALNRRPPKIYDVFRTDEGTSTVLNEEETEAAQNKMFEIQRAFFDIDTRNGWAVSDPELGGRIADAYNNALNREVLRQFNGDYLTTPGISGNWRWRPHQTRVISRIIMEGNTYMAHAVGAGKTSAMIGAGMEMKRLGLVRKPMYVVPNHMLGQFAKEFYEQYPAARIAIADDEQFHTDRRRQFMSNVAADDLDAVIITHTSFKKIPVSEAFRRRAIQEEIDELTAAMSEVEGDRFTVRRLEAMKEKLEQKLSTRPSGKDQTLNFEDMGVDFLFVDEAHCFRYGTLVSTDHGLLPIGEIVERRLQVRVASYDHQTDRLVWRSIHNYWKHDGRDKQFVSISVDGHMLHCTRNHQIYVEGRGYVRADSIKPGEDLRVLQEDIYPDSEGRSWHWTGLLQPPMRQTSHCPDNNKDMRNLFPGVFLLQPGTEKECREALLQRPLLDEMDYGPTWEGRKIDNPNARGGKTQMGGRPSLSRHESSPLIGAYENEQSHEIGGCQGQDAGISFGPNFLGSGWQWEADQAADVAARYDRASDGICDSDGLGQRSLPEFTQLLQSRFGGRNQETGYRDRWTQPPTEEMEVFGSSKNGSPGFARVVSIEIHKRGGDGNARGGGREDRWVYDLGIEGEHNYFADGFLVHNSFRKLSFVTMQGNLKGVDPTGSDGARDLHMKVRYLESQRPGRSVVLASGTPVTNTMGELFSISRYLQPNALAAKGLSKFDAWAQTFASTKVELEQNPDGSYNPQTRLSQFVNMPELYKMVGSVMDIVTSQQLSQYVTRPKLRNGERTFNQIPPTPEQIAYAAKLGGRLQAIKERKGPPEKGDDILLTVIGDGRHAAIDPRFVENTQSDTPSKLNKMLANVVQIWKDSEDTQFYDPASNYEKPSFRGPATQMIFCNLGINPREPTGFSAYDWMKEYLRRAGIPPAEVAFIRDYKTTVAKQGLFNDMNEGKVRILIGSTQKMGTGVNAQRRLLAVHNLDPLWFPADDEQRNGRILRQGNHNPEIQIHDYATNGSYDSTMWKMMGRKAGFIEQFFRGDPNLRDMEDLGEASMYEQAAAMTTSDPRVMQLTQMKIDLKRAILRREGFRSNQWTLRNKFEEHEKSAASYDRRAAMAEQDILDRQDITGKKFTAKIEGETYTVRDDFNKAIDAAVLKYAPVIKDGTARNLGEIGGFPIRIYKYLGGATSLEILFNGDRDRNLGGISENHAASAAALMRNLEQDVTYYKGEAIKERAAAAAIKPLMGGRFTEDDEIARLDSAVKEFEAALKAPIGSENSAKPPPRSGVDLDEPTEIGTPPVSGRDVDIPDDMVPD